MMKNTNKNLSIIFENKPKQWGLRGNPYMWDYLQKYCEEIPINCGEEKIKEIIESKFTEKTGEELTSEAQAYDKEFDHGGMSSGRISGSFWLEVAIPLLVDKYRKC